MTEYNFEGQSVLVKPPLATESAIAETDIKTGDVVLEGTVDRNQYRISAISGAVSARGVATEPRTAADPRPVTAVKKGECRVVSDGQGVLSPGDRLKTSNLVAGRVMEFIEGTDPENACIGTVKFDNAGRVADTPATAGTLLIADIDIKGA